MKVSTLLLCLIVSLSFSQASLETKIQTGHSSKVIDYAVSGDGNIIYSAGYDRKILMSDLRASRELKAFAGHELAISSIDLSPDNTLLVSGSYDRLVILWDVNSGKAVKTLKGHDEAVTSVAFSPDGKFVASGSDVVFVWDVATGTKLKTLSDSKNIYTGFSALNKLQFSSDGKFIIAKYATGSVLCWNAATGELHKRIPIPVTTEARETKLSMPGANDAEDNLNFHVGMFERSAMWGSSVTNSAKKMASMIKIDGGKISMPKQSSYTFSDAREGYDNGDNSMEIIPQTTYFITGKTVPELYDFDKGIQYNIAIEGDGHTASIRRVSLSEGAEYIVTSSKNESIIWQFDWKGAKIKKLSTLSDKGVAFSVFPGSSNFIRTDGYGFLDVAKFDQGFRSIFSLTKSAYPVKALDISPDGKIFSLGVQSDNTVHSWDLQRSKEIRMTGTDQEYSEVSNLKYTPNSKFLVATVDSEPEYIGWNENAGKGKLMVFDSEKNVIVVESEIESGAAVMAVAPDSRRVAIGTRKPGLKEEGGRIIVIDFVDKKMVGNFIGYDNISGVSFSPDGKRLAFCDYYDATMNVKEIKSRIGILDLETKKEIAGPWMPPDSLGLYCLSYSPDGKTLAAGGYKNAYIFDATTGAITKTLKGHQLKINSIQFSPDGKKLATGSNDNTAIIFDIATAKPLFTLKGHSSTVTNAVWHPKNPIILTSSLDGSVKAWSTATGQQVVSYVSLLIRSKSQTGETIYRDGMVAVTPDNYYVCNRAAYDGIHFVKDNRYYNFLNFDLQYNRPDVILKRMGMAEAKEIDMYKRAHDKRIAKMGFTDSNFGTDVNLPELKVTVPQDVTTSNPVLSVPIEASDAKYPLKSILVFVNGVPIMTRKGLDISAKKALKHAQGIEIKLSAGRNNIEISVLNEKGVESIIETFTINYNPPTPKKNTLYLLAIGAGKYQDQTKNLTYPVKDANDLVTMLKKNSTKYENIVTEVLENENVTKAKVMALKEKIKNTNPDDEVVLFYAGHGVLNTSLNYYLGTYDIKFAQPELAGLAYEDLESILDGIPARKKMLLVDACHSGEIDKGEVMAVQSTTTATGNIKFRDVGGTTVKNVGLENSFELMKELFADLRRGSGTSVISAAGGGEFALESSDWKNGVFTYVLLDAMGNKKADANNDGKVYLSELLQYTQKEVEKLTNGKQKPTSRAENISFDWEVY